MNRVLTSLKLLAAGCVAVVVAGCATDGGPMAPVQPTVSTAGTTASPLLTADGVSVLGLRNPLAADVTVSSVIGAAGGMILVPQTGFLLIVPPGAVKSNTTFSVTALAGAAVAYNFEPHGATFKVPLLYVQNLLMTDWVLGQRLGGGYFKERGQVDSKHKKAKTDEAEDLTILNGQAVMQLWHFSGYLVSCA